MIEILCSTTMDGNMSIKYSEDGRKNKLKYLKNHQIDNKNTLYLNIQNKDIIFDTNFEDIELTNNYGDFIANADSIVTSTNNQLIYCLFGDCIPLIIYDRKKEIVSLSHLGWVSTASDLHLKVLDYFINKYNSNIDDLEMYIGPSIKKESYKFSIKEEFKQVNEKQWNNYIDKDDQYYYIDLVGYVVNTLKEKGIKNISIDNNDTYTSELYFSHHKSWMENIPDGRFLYGVRMKRG